LDIVTLNVLENFLEEFQGCLLVVTHDRYFMDKLVDHLFVFEGDGKIKDYTGRYSDYRLELKEKEAQEKQAEKQVEKEKNNMASATELNNNIVEKPKNKLSFKEKFELEQLEKELPALEVQKSELEDKLNNNITDHQELLKITQKLGYVTKQLDEKTDRWLILSELQ
jgi:ATP-binding cassette subfamily F protein uup